MCRSCTGIPRYLAKQVLGQGDDSPTFHILAPNRELRRRDQMLLLVVMAQGQVCSLHLTFFRSGDFLIFFRESTFHRQN